ncbi:Gfo/Idh/MocA family protein [Paludibaculum fermentans]|uniref:Gfo/Idh/MocA family protein n=1 Tax=Paludibaculum fermentans TaxID=1473598 RepID=UPI003EC11998
MRVFLFLLAATALPAADLRLGIVGTDTSHSVAFTALLNDAANKNHLAGARVVAAYKGGSSDIKESSSRVDKFAEELSTKYGVELTPDIATLLTKVDAVLLESVDGRKHLEQFRQIVKAGKPVFIDKPLASSLADAREIARLARENNVKWFSASVLRFSDVLPALKVDGLNGVYAWGPGPLEEHHQLSLSWYGVHTVETLFTMLGRGCEEVTFTASDDADVVTGKWKDGRIGTIRVIRPYSAFGVTAFSPKAIKTNEKDLYTGYQNLVKEIIQFFQTGKAPIDEQETLEMFAFMDAAQRSKEAGGAPTKLR